MAKQVRRGFAQHVREERVSNDRGPAVMPHLDVDAGGLTQPPRVLELGRELDLVTRVGELSRPPDRVVHEMADLAELGTRPLRIDPDQSLRERGLQLDDVQHVTWMSCRSPANRIRSCTIASSAGVARAAATPRSSRRRPR